MVMKIDDTLLDEINTQAQASPRLHLDMNMHKSAEDLS